MQKTAPVHVLLIMLLAGTFLCGATWTHAEEYGLYAAMYDESFVWGDTETPALIAIGDIGDFAPRAMTYDFANEIIYAVHNQNDPDLAVVDPLTGMGTVLGGFSLPAPDFIGRAEALAYNTEDGLLYCSVSVNDYNTQSEALATIDPSTQEVTVLGQIVGTYANDGDAMVFVDGVLYMIDDPHLGPSYFYRVDHQDNVGQAELVGILNDPRFNNVNDMAFDPETRTLYGYDPHARLLITIDWLTGQGTLLGSSHEPEDFDGTVMSSMTVGPPYTQTAVAEDILPATIGRLIIAPNPFNPATIIRFRVPGEAGISVPIELSVFDIAGRMVRELYTGCMPAGTQSVRWTGRNVSGSEVAGGIYIVRLSVRGKVISQKITLAK